MTKHLGHQDYINQLINKIDGVYDSIETNVEYDGGEIDLIGHIGNMIDIYEVKCHGHKNHAINQLRKAKNKFRSEVKRTFFYDGRLGKLEMV